MTTSALQHAIDHLQIRDVYLRDLHSSRLMESNPKYAIDYDSLELQSKREVTGTGRITFENGITILEIVITLGVRWMPKSESSASGKTTSQQQPHAQIEATFIAEYQMNQPLDKETIKLFAERNAGYHIWPYWRELINSQCSRMNLPHVMLAMKQFGHQAADPHTPSTQLPSSAKKIKKSGKKTKTNP